METIPNLCFPSLCCCFDLAPTKQTASSGKKRRLVSMSLIMPVNLKVKSVLNFDLTGSLTQMVEFTLLHLIVELFTFS